MTNTPTPWKFDQDDARIYHADGDVEPTIGYVEREGCSQAQINADGYLMAAAPEMLAALQAVLGFEIATPKDYAAKGADAFTPLQKHIIEVQNKARKAIALAQGLV